MAANPEHGDAQKNILAWASKDGAFRRQASSFRNVIEKGGEFPPEKGKLLNRERWPKMMLNLVVCSGRYHLYISHACPWANRTAIVRRLKGLESFIDITVVSPYMGTLGWPFKKASELSIEGAEDDPLYGVSHIRELYFKANPEYKGRCVLSDESPEGEKRLTRNPVGSPSQCCGTRRPRRS